MTDNIDFNVTNMNKEVDLFKTQIQNVNEMQILHLTSVYRSSARLI